MLKAGNHLVFGGMPRGQFSSTSDGKLLVVSADKGETVSTLTLDAPVAWDGMAAARKGLYLSLENGTLVCLR
jgi:hypothetical protein